MTTRPWRAAGHNRLAITLRLTACAVALVLLMLITGCGRDAGTPEDQLRQWVAAVESAVENKAHGDIMPLIAAPYNDARGNTRDDVGKLLRLYFLRQNSIALLTSIEDIQVAGGSAATVTLTVGMAGTNDRALGLDADAYRFELELEAADEPQSYADWRLLSARWGELGESPR